ncbi:MAG: hypothetical protein RL748_4582 [Pseudomonadota bacterium]
MQQKMLVLDDHRAVASMIACYFCAEFEVDCVTALAELITATQKTQYDVLIIDLKIGKDDVLANLARIRASNPHIVVFSGTYTFHDFCDCVKSGIKCFVGKDEGVERLACAVSSACQGSEYYPPSMMKSLLALHKKDKPLLNKTQLAVLTLLANKPDASNDEIGKLICKAPGTVANIVSILLETFDVDNRYLLAAQAQRLGYGLPEHLVH